jgi:hypothetical protein
LGQCLARVRLFAGFGSTRGYTHRDESVRLFIDVSDAPESIAFFHEFKERIKVRFEQIDIWITTYPVDVF